MEIASSSVLNMETYGIQKGNSIAKSVFQGILNNLTSANYASSVTSLAADFDLDEIIDLMNTGFALNMPYDQRSLILQYDYYTNLLRIPALIDASAYSSADPILRGQIGQVFGIRLFQSNIIPLVEGLRGMLAHPSALAVAMRYLQPQEGNTYFRAEPMTDPIGITLGIPDWYDNGIGRRIKVMANASTARRLALLTDW